MGVGGSSICALIVGTSCVSPPLTHEEANYYIGWANSGVARRRKIPAPAGLLQPTEEWIAPEQTEQNRNTANGQRERAHDCTVRSHPCDLPAQEPRQDHHPQRG